MPDSVALVDGVMCGRLPADDRGLAYGDGVFRTVRMANHAPLAWATHVERLAHDCQRLCLPMPDPDRLLQDATRLFGARADGVLKIMITRGSGGRGYAPPQPARPRRIVSAHALPVAIESLRLEVASVRLARQPMLAGVKHLNRLEQVLARAECARNDWDDALMLDSQARVISTTMRNLIADIDGRWLTPRLAQAGVIGATRTRIMAAVAAAGGALTEADLSLADCVGARAMVACNSVAGVVPITGLAGHDLSGSRAMAAACTAALRATEE